MSAGEKIEARKSLRELVRHVLDCGSPLRGMTYSDLAARIGRLNKHGQGHGRVMGPVLGAMGHLLEDLQGDWGEPIPAIQRLVISKTSGLPSDGLDEFWPSYSMLTKPEKSNRVGIEYERITQFGSRWNKVLADLDIPQVKREDSASTNELVSPGASHGEGGESACHRALKEYVREHPEVVGATAVREALTEYALPSLDTVDVLFKCQDRWFAVEVKSRVSDHVMGDYARGVYQCVKYQAILETMHFDRAYPVPSHIETVLVLEAAVPSVVRDLARRLGLRVIDNVTVVETAP